MNKHQLLQEFRKLLDKERRSWNTGNHLVDITNQGINVGHAGKMIQIADKHEEE